MNRTIQYGVEQDTGLVYSRVGSEAAGPVLDFAAIGQGGAGYAPGDFRGPTRYTLEKMPVREVYPCCRWTRKVPVEVKNRHREFWGFRPLPVLLSAAVLAALVLAGCGSASSPNKPLAAAAATSAPPPAPVPTFSPYSQTYSPPGAPSRPPGCGAATGAIRWTLANSSEGFDAVMGHLKGVIARIPAGPLRKDVGKFGGSLGLGAIYTSRGNTVKADQMAALAGHWVVQIRRLCKK